MRNYWFVIGKGFNFAGVDSKSFKICQSFHQVGKTSTESDVSFLRPQTRSHWPCCSKFSPRFGSSADRLVQMIQTCMSRTDWLVCCLKYFNLVTVLAVNLNQLPAIIYMLKYVFCDEDVVVPLYQWNSIPHPTSGLFSTTVINFELVWL